MSEHWNVQVSIQRVEEPQIMKNSGGYEVKGLGGTPQMTERKVEKVLEFAVRADDQEEACTKAMSILELHKI